MSAMEAASARAANLVDRGRRKGHRSIAPLTLIAVPRTVATSNVVVIALSSHLRLRGGQEEGAVQSPVTSQGVGNQ